MERENVIASLRACLVATKGGIKIDHLNQDYRILNEENIPFRKLGYQSLHAFLSTVPGIRAVDRHGECYVEAIPSEQTAHLTKLVSQQKTVCKKNRKKLTNFRKPMPYRQPTTLNRNIAPIKSGQFYMPVTGRVQNVKENNDSKVVRQNSLILAAERPTYSERPRYMQSNSGVPPISPSKKLKEKKMNSLLSSTNQSINKPKNDTHVKNIEKLMTPVINQKPKISNNNMENPIRVKTSNISERLKVTPNIQPLLNLQTSIPTMSKNQVLSPLSPAQVLSGRNIPQLYSTIVGNANENPVPKSRTSSSDPRLDLLDRTNALNLPEPVYQIVPMKTKSRKAASVFAQVKIGSQGYASYPEEAHSVDEAEKIAARIALQDLMEKYGSSSGLATTTDKNLIKQRILAIVDSHSNGIFMHQVPIYYKQEHKEVLPANWGKTIEECSSISLEKGVDNSVILRRYSSPTKMRDTPSPKNEKIQLNPIGPPVPGQLQLPERDVWMVSVTYVVSSTEVWVRLTDDEHSEQFDNTMEEMKQYYNRIQQSAKLTIEIGNYYVVCEDELWHRVQCIDYSSATEEVTVVFIDIGDEEKYHCSRLHELEKKFCTLPAQAFRVRLAGLEDFSDCDSAEALIESLLLDLQLYVEVIKCDTIDDKPSASVVFYDTHGPLDINLNAKLYAQIQQHVVFATKLDVEGQVSELYISHLEQNGDIYVQIQSESMRFLVRLLNRVIHSGLNAEDRNRSSVTTIDKTKLYFVSSKGNWYRGRVVDDSSYDQLRVYLIDFGKTITTKIKNLLCLEKLSELLAKYPPQAIKVHLHNIDRSMFNEKMAARLAELAPKNESLIVKVVSPNRDAPVVELFKRIQPSNMLVSINNTLAYEEKLTSSRGDGNNNIKPRKRIERTNSKVAGNEEEDVVKSLKPPKISEIGEYFDIHVTMAAHPGNFTIQPFDDKKLLEIMMIQLQESCRSYKGPLPTPESVKQGKLYAAEHIDGHWYRVCISSIIREDIVSVYFCDFGDVSVLPLNKLQPLKSQFLELPYQAIKAKLVGIQPANVDWSVEDSLRFQELVVDKNFVSLVVESHSHGLSPADTVLGLKLIDVETSEDVYVDQLLVDEGRAMFIDST